MNISCDGRGFQQVPGFWAAINRVKRSFERRKETWVQTLEPQSRDEALKVMERQCQMPIIVRSMFQNERTYFSSTLRSAKRFSSPQNININFTHTHSSMILNFHSMSHSIKDFLIILFMAKLLLFRNIGMVSPINF